MSLDSDLQSIQEVRTKIEQAYSAWQKYRRFTQQQVDTIVEAMAEAARANAQRLAAMAVEETGYGNAPDKLAKNLLSADLLPRTIRGMKTIGVIREIPGQKIVEIATPMGIVAAVLPTTNPTSTAIYKVIIALKAGNAIVVSPHPRARRCTCETVAVMTEAAIRAGAPEGLIGCITNPSLEATEALMKHKRTGVILSTGGTGIVRAAYSSGKPALGVGPGNVPVLVDVSADVAYAVAGVVSGKTFDYGTICSSEQAIVAERGLRDRILAELKKCKAYLCSAEQAKALAQVLLTPQFTVTADCVGQAAPVIARKAGFEVPEHTTVLVAEIEGVGKEHPLSAEKLSPVLSLLFVDSFQAAIVACQAILRFGGLGHTCAIYGTDDARIREYAMRMPAFRVLANTPTPQGATGITTNVFPAMTLGCGAVAGNITSDNIGPQHLINVKRLAYHVRSAGEAFPGSAAATSMTNEPIDRQRIVSAVERYLQRRGSGSGPAAAAPAPAPAPAPASGGRIADLVDQALAARRPQTLPTPVPAAVRAEPIPQTPPPPVIADFVCEDDVRVALRKQCKIYIGPRTIVTPSARDLGTQYDILVVAERGTTS
jgi:acetaldehyde dehydrogenase (acetylating)